VRVMVKGASSINADPKTRGMKIRSGRKWEKSKGLWKWTRHRKLMTVVTDLYYPWADSFGRLTFTFDH